MRIPDSICKVQPRAPPSEWAPRATDAAMCTARTNVADCGQWERRRISEGTGEWRLRGDELCCGWRRSRVWEEFRDWFRVWSSMMWILYFRWQCGIVFWRWFQICFSTLLMLCFGFSLVMVVYAAGAWKREWWQYGLQLVRLELHGVRESPIHANFDSFMWRIHDHMQFFWDISGQPSRHWFLLKEMKKQACFLCLKQFVRLHGAGDEEKSALRSRSPSFLNNIGIDNTEMLV